MATGHTQTRQREGSSMSDRRYLKPPWGQRHIANRLVPLFRSSIVSKLTTTLLEPVAESIDDSKKFIASEIARARELLKSVNFQPT